MNYASTLCIVLIVLSQGSAQNLVFSTADPQPNIHEVYGGSILSADLDLDGDIDIVQSGLGEDLAGASAQPTVFLNDGNGNFTVKEQAFNSFFSTEKMAIGDLDNENDMDLIITAINRTDFYRNDGQAGFVHDESATFQPSNEGELIVGDVDGDGDQDVLHFGHVSGENSFASLFINNGSGIFAMESNTPFIPFLFAQIEWIDLEGDGDKDIISFGQNDINEPQVAIYENDGLGKYTLFPNSNIAPHTAEEISVGDIDNDGDEDFLISGGDQTNTPKTIMYINNGNGQFSESMNSSFPDIFASSNALADLDNDNDLDVLLIGSLAGGLPNIFSIVFENIGNSNFIASDSLGGEYIAQNTIADFNGDGKQDIIIQGFVDDTNVYWNESIITSIEEDNISPVTIYPNPAHGAFKVEWEYTRIDRIDMVDIHGKTAYSQTINEQGFCEVHFPGLMGVYLLKIYSDQGIYTEKILLTD